MSCCHDFLVRLGIPTQCVERRTSAEERGRHFSLRLEGGLVALRVRVDGCWLSGTEQRKVDYLFLAELSEQTLLCLLVELKGGHYGEALEQLAATLQHLEALPPYRHQRPQRLAAHIVLSHGNQIPRYQQRESQLRQRYGVQIRRSSQRGEYRV